MCVTLSGITIDSNDVQQIKTSSSILVTPFGIIIDCNDSQ